MSPEAKRNFTGSIQQQTKNIEMLTQWLEIQEQIENPDEQLFLQAFEEYDGK